jgi:hypothetical protein
MVNTTIHIPGREETTPAFARNITLDVKLNSLLVGRALPDVAMTYRPGKHESSPTRCFQLPLSNQAIEEIENCRMGRDFAFELQFNGECGDDEYTARAQDTKSYAVNQKAWIDLLKDMKWGNHLLWEVPIDLQPSPSMAEAIGQIERAKKQIQYGEYNATIATCRKIMEILKPEFGGDSKFSAPKDPTMSKRERLKVLREALHHLTHVAVHLTKGQDVYFSRSEAMMVLGATVGMLCSSPLNDSLD